MLRRCVLLAAATLTCASMSAQTPEQIALMTLTVDVYPTHGLPLIPPLLKVTVSNGTGSEMTMPRLSVRLSGIRPDGSPFRVSCDEGAYVDVDDIANHLASTDRPVETVRIPAKGAYVTYLPADENTLFLDRSFSAAGNYDVRFNLAIGGSSSNVVRYTVDAPQGEDLPVWSAINQSNSVNPFIDEGLAMTFAAHPTSPYAKLQSYYHYLMDPLPPDQAAQRLQAFIATGLPASLGAYVRVRLAAIYHQIAQERAMKLGSVDDASLKFLQLGYDVLKQVAGGKDPLGSYLANTGLRELPWTRQELEKLLESTRPRKIQAIEPHADCVVRNSDGTYAAWFGYTNKNDGILSIDVGSNNSFSPEPSDRGQVTVFDLGEQQRAFSIHMQRGEQLKWMLNGRTAVANAEGDRANCDTPVPPTN